jgi:acyl-CoA reductase-like NAD-dependent aldehyde dehydrogenase
VLQVVQGDGRTGAALVNGGVDKISFTGSVATGRKIGEACGRQLIPCTLELGGKDPAVVLEDAPMERTVGGVIFAGLMNAGQFCAGTERVYAVGAAYEPFVKELTVKMSALRLGDDIGPFISERQLDLVEQQVNDAVAAGAKVECGGKREGAFFQPTVLTGVTHDMAIMSEETFGPILPVMKASSEDEAIRLANDTRFGLSATVWTKDKARGERVARQLNAGSVCVNDSCITYGALEVPFGGMGESGVGSCNGGIGALRGFTHSQPILSDRFLMKREHVWHPYGPKTTEELDKALDAIFGNSILAALVS